MSEIEKMMYKPHEAFEEELEALVQDPDEDEGFNSDNAMDLE